MKDVEKQDETGRSIVLTQISCNYLTETAKWGKFLAIIGYIAAGIMVLAGLFMLIAGVFGLGMGTGTIPVPFSLVLVMVLYIPMAVVYFFIATYLYRFSTYAREAVHLNDSTLLENSMKQQKSCYKLVGIVYHSGDCPLCSDNCHFSGGRSFS